MKCYCRRGAGWRGDLGVALLLSVHGGGVLHASQGTQAPSLVGTGAETWQARRSPRPLGFLGSVLSLEPWVLGSRTSHGTSSKMTGSCFSFSVLLGRRVFGELGT